MNFLHEAMQRSIDDLAKKKEQVFLDKLKELEIEFDPEEEKDRLFKSFHRVIENNSETIFYNDGSATGLRIITFVQQSPQFDFKESDHSGKILALRYHYF